MADIYSDDYYQKKRKEHFKFDKELYQISQDVLDHKAVTEIDDANSPKTQKAVQPKPEAADDELNLSIKKLRSSQNDRQDIIEKFIKVDEKRHQKLVEYQNEIAQRKAAAQKAIIRKVNSQPKKITKDENPTSDINFIRPALKNSSEQVLAKAQDKLHYTLQMDVLTADKIQEIKDLQDRAKILNNKFAKLDPFIHKMYIRLVSILGLLVVAITLIVILL